MNRHNQGDCCDDLYTEFEFQDLRSASPPKKRGVYVIRVNKKGRCVTEIVEQVEPLVKSLNWEVVGRYIGDRISRLKEINQCPIIYIGSAGPHQNSKNTLKLRYQEFSGRHTATYPIWALLYFGWELELGWKEEHNPGNAETQLKQEYKQRHNNKLPALVKR